MFRIRTKLQGQSKYIKTGTGQVVKFALTTTNNNFIFYKYQFERNIALVFVLS